MISAKLTSGQLLPRRGKMLVHQWTQRKQWLMLIMHLLQTKQCSRKLMSLASFNNYNNLRDNCQQAHYIDENTEAK